jgi:hypothetical protein
MNKKLTHLSLGTHNRKKAPSLFFINRRNYMTISQIANLMSIPIAVVCLSISIRAFYIYHLSRSDMLFVLGLAMASIGIGTFTGTIGDAHIGGNHFATDWTRSFGACSGGLFIFLSSLMKSHQQMLYLRRWQIWVAGIFLLVILLTPLFPPVPGPYATLALNACRMIIYTCAFVRYAMLYATKVTRFSLILGIGFFVLVIGYSLNIPGIFSSQFAFLTIVAATVRIVAYLTLLGGYSVR